MSIADTSFEAGFSGTSRLHDLFVSVEAMTPGEFKNGGESLMIDYCFADTLFGRIIIAATSRGICKVDFINDELVAVAELQQRFQKALLRETSNPHHDPIIRFFNEDWTDLPTIKLHLKGSPFQLKVWEALLRIPSGELTTYSSIANTIDTPKAYRAVGTAIGENPVAYLIPCHRVIKNSGIIGEYRWGTVRKLTMIGREQSQLQPEL